jgi:hypothetical protein
VLWPTRGSVVNFFAAVAARQAEPIIEKLVGDRRGHRTTLGADRLTDNGDQP